MFSFQTFSFLHCERIHFCGFQPPPWFVATCNADAVTELGFEGESEPCILSGGSTGVFIPVAERVCEGKSRGNYYSPSFLGPYQPVGVTDKGVCWPFRVPSSSSLCSPTPCAVSRRLTSMACRHPTSLSFGFRLGLANASHWQQVGSLLPPRWVTACSGCASLRTVPAPVLWPSTAPALVR